MKNFAESTIKFQEPDQLTYHVYDPPVLDEPIHDPVPNPDPNPVPTPNPNPSPFPTPPEPILSFPPNVIF